MVGDHVTTTVQETEREYFPQRFLLHEEYNEATLDNDIALIELNETIEYNEEIAPVCLPTDQPSVGAICTTTGWGETRGTGDKTHLNEVDIPIVSNEVCNSTEYYNGSITPNMVCAGFRRHGICVGDSGGPLVYNNNGNSPYSLVGVTSWRGLNCQNGDGKKPSGFVNVYNYVEWIQNSTTNCEGYIHSDDGQCYKYFENAMIYSEAEKFCRSMGSYLVEIGSSMEQNLVKQLVEDNYAWIGLQDKTQNGKWSHWNSGAPVEFSNWRDEEPNNEYGEEYCAELRNHGDWNGKWNDKNCQHKQNFVCERDGHQIFHTERSKWYAYHKEEKHYAEAQETCATEGGYLVEINTEDEQSFLQGLRDRWDIFWIGLSDRHTEGNWRKWNSGAPVMYSNWRSGEPNNNAHHPGEPENCGEMNYRGKWNDEQCNKKRWFVCENSSRTTSSGNVEIFRKI